MFEPKAKNPVGTLEKTIRVLEHIKDSEGATLEELDQKLPFAKSTIHRHLATLRQEGYVDQLGGKFEISLRLFDLASYKRERNPLFHIGRPIADEVANQIEERVSLIVEEHGYAVKCYIAETDRSVTTDAHLGLSMHMHCTSGGKAMLAYMDDDIIRNVINTHGLPRLTGNTITKQGDLLNELEDVREDGIAFDNQERIAGVRGVATPVIEKNSGDLLGAIDIAGPATRLEGEKYEKEIPDLVRRASDEVTVNVQYWRSQ